MSDDGAQLGYGAQAALGAALGGEQPSDEERESAEEMAASIMTLTEDPNTYDGTPRWCAKLILLWLRQDPQRAQTPTESVYEKDALGDLVFNEEGGLNLIDLGWYDRMKADGIALNDLGLSGFQWGWAVNAARRCLELPEVPNPAILTL